MLKIWLLYPITVVIIHARKTISVIAMAGILGMKVRVISWIYVMACGIEMARPTTSARIKIGAEMGSVVYIETGSPAG